MTVNVAVTLNGLPYPVAISGSPPGVTGSPAVQLHAHRRRDRVFAEWRRSTGSGAYVVTITSGRQRRRWWSSADHADEPDFHAKWGHLETTEPPLTRRPGDKVAASSVSRCSSPCRPASSTRTRSLFSAREPAHRCQPGGWSGLRHGCLLMDPDGGRHRDARRHLQRHQLDTGAATAPPPTSSSGPPTRRPCCSPVGDQTVAAGALLDVQLSAFAESTTR